MRAARAVVARQTDNEKTNKISSPQPSPKERECSNGKVRRRNERTKDEQKTNKERTKNEQRTVRAARADGEKTKKISSPQSHTLLFGDFSQGEGV